MRTAEIFKLHHPLHESALGFAGERKLLRKQARAISSAEKHESVGNLFAAGRLFMQAGRRLILASEKSGSSLLQEEGKHLLQEAVRCFRSEMELYGHMRMKAKGEMLWEFDYPLIREPSEHPANYLMISRCLKLLGDKGGSCEATGKHRQLYGRMLCDKCCCASVRLLELRRRVMGVGFSRKGSLADALKIVRSEEQLLSCVSKEESLSFFRWLRGLANLKNPFKGEALATREIARNAACEMRTN